MVKSILIGLDGSPFSQAAIELSMHWAKQADIMLVGIGIIPEPSIISAAPTPVVPGLPPIDPMAEKLRVDRQLFKDEFRKVESYLQQFALKCAEQKIACKLLEDIGHPPERIVRQSERFDLVILGRRTFFLRDGQEEVDAVIKDVARHCPRPVVTVPNSLRPGKCVLVAYDGSIQAARALQAFESSGLLKDHKIRILSIAESHEEAEAHAQRAVDFLTWHDRKSQVVAVATRDNPAEVIQQHTWKDDPSLLVMGVFGHSRLREYLFGSVTRSLLKTSPVPMFLVH